MFERDVSLDEQPRDCRVEWKPNLGLKSVIVHDDAALGRLVGPFILTRRPKGCILRNFVPPPKARKQMLVMTLSILVTELRIIWISLGFLGKRPWIFLDICIVRGVGEPLYRSGTFSPVVVTAAHRKYQPNTSNHILHILRGIALRNMHHLSRLPEASPISAFLSAKWQSSHSSLPELLELTTISTIFKTPQIKRRKRIRREQHIYLEQW